ncbi:MAG: hypothetical protein RR075_04190, partial [Pygmaiobacter sp.]
LLLQAPTLLLQAPTLLLQQPTLLLQAPTLLLNTVQIKKTARFNHLNRAVHNIITILLYLVSCCFLCKRFSICTVEHPAALRQNVPLSAAAAHPSITCAAC